MYQALLIQYVIALIGSTFAYYSLRRLPDIEKPPRLSLPAVLGAAIRHSVRARREFLASLVAPSLQLVAAIATVGLLIVVSGGITGLDGEPLDERQRGKVGLDRAINTVCRAVAGARWRSEVEAWFQHQAKQKRRLL